LNHSRFVQEQPKEGSWQERGASVKPPALTERLWLPGGGWLLLLMIALYETTQRERSFRHGRGSQAPAVSRTSRLAAELNAAAELDAAAAAIALVPFHGHRRLLMTVWLDSCSLDDTTQASPWLRLGPLDPPRPPLPRSCEREAPRASSSQSNLGRPLLIPRHHLP
jgi:hypothetical protein